MMMLIRLQSQTYLVEAKLLIHVSQEVGQRYSFSDQKRMELEEPQLGVSHSCSHLNVAET